MGGAKASCARRQESVSVVLFAYHKAPTQFFLQRYHLHSSARIASPCQIPEFLRTQAKWMRIGVKLRCNIHLKLLEQASAAFHLWFSPGSWPQLARSKWMRGILLWRPSLPQVNLKSGRSEAGLRPVPCILFCWLKKRPGCTTHLLQTNSFNTIRPLTHREPDLKRINWCTTQRTIPSHGKRNWVCPREH